MLSCFYKGKFFNNDQEGYTEIDKRLMGKRGELVCPICNERVYYNSKGKVISHFSHYPGTACDEKLLRSYDVHNEVHDNAKTLLARWIRAQFPYADLVKDRYFPSIGLLSDLYFEAEDTKIAIEVQIKHITPEKLIQRRSLYKSIGVKDLWLFIRGETINPGSPYERHYYQSNNRELYYINADTGKFTYFKGLKKERFDKPGLNLVYYISKSCDLKDVAIGSKGTLNLPGCREAYAARIWELREKLHQELDKRKRFKNDVQTRLDNKNNYITRRNVPQQPNEGVRISPKKQQVNSSDKRAPLTKKNNTINEYEYDEIIICEDMHKKHLDILFKGETGCTRYELISSSEAKEFFLYICRGVKSDLRTSAGKGYVMKAYAGRHVLQVEEWF